MLQPGLAARVGHAVMRPLREVAARVKAAQWLIVAVAVIMASLVLIVGLSKGFALIGLVSFVVSVVGFARQDTGHFVGTWIERPSAAMQNVSAMRVMAEALPDPVILLGPDGHVLFSNAEARSLFASLREGRQRLSVIRTPEFLDAVAAAPGLGRAVTVTYAERVPVGRRMGATVRPVERGRGSGTAQCRSAARPHRDRTHQPDARRFHRQCESRVKDPARIAPRLHRDAAGKCQRRSRRSRPLPSDHGRAGLANDAPH